VASVVSSPAPRTGPAGTTALALADARAQVDAALAAARRATEQALAGVPTGSSSTGPSLAEALALMDAILKGR